MKKRLLVFLLSFALCDGCGLSRVSREKLAELGGRLAWYEVGHKELYITPAEETWTIRTDAVNVRGDVRHMGILCFRVPEEWEAGESTVEKQVLILDEGLTVDRYVHHVTLRHTSAERAVEATWVPAIPEFPWDGHARRVYMSADQLRRYCGDAWGFVVKSLEVTPDDVARTDPVFLEGGAENRAKLALLSNKYLGLWINNIQILRMERIRCGELKAIAIWGAIKQDNQALRTVTLVIANEGRFLGSLHFRAKGELTQNELRRLVADVLATAVAAPP